MNLLSFNQPKSNTKSIKGTQKHKLRNTKEQAQEHKPFKHKHDISNTIAQIQAQIQKI